MNGFSSLHLFASLSHTVHTSTLRVPLYGFAEKDTYRWKIVLVVDSAGSVAGAPALSLALLEIPLVKRPTDERWGDPIGQETDRWEVGGIPLVKRPTDERLGDPIGQETDRWEGGWIPLVKRPPHFLISYRSRRGHHGSKKGDKKPVIKQVLKLDVSNKREGQRLRRLEVLTTKGKI